MVIVALREGRDGYSSSEGGEGVVTIVVAIKGGHTCVIVLKNSLLEFQEL